MYGLRTVRSPLNIWQVLVPAANWKVRQFSCFAQSIAQKPSEVRVALKVVVRLTETISVALKPWYLAQETAERHATAVVDRTEKLYQS